MHRTPGPIEKHRSNPQKIPILKKPAVKPSVANRSLLVRWCLALPVLFGGCSQEIASAPTGGSYGMVSEEPSSDHTSDGSSGGAVTAAASPASPVSTADACANPQSWRASHDFSFEASNAAPRFAEAINPLIRATDASPFAISNYMAPGCIWKVAFSALDDGAASGPPEHAVTFTEMFRHPAGLWTVAPQTSGWIRLVDAHGQTVWIPLARVTGSAVYGGATDCSSLGSAKASGVIPFSASALHLAIPAGDTTLGDLLGPPDSSDPPGWAVRFSFSANSDH